VDKIRIGKLDVSVKACTFSY